MNRAILITIFLLATPVLGLEYKLPEYTNPMTMSWLNNDTLAITVRNKSHQKSDDFGEVYFWHMRTQSAALAAPSALFWCASAGVFTYEKSRSYPRIPFGLASKQILDRNPIRSTMVRQSSQSQEEFTINTQSSPVLEKIPFLSHQNPQFAKQPEKFNPFDCSWTSSPRFAAQYPSYAWEYLRSGDGIIAFRAESPADWMHTKMTAVHYKTESAAPVDLPITADGLDINAVRHYDFHNAYFITVPETSSSAGKCQSAWWFRPNDDNVEQICSPFEALDGQDVRYVPSKKGLLRLLRFRKTLLGDKPGGVYLTDAKGRTAKIWEGMVDGAAVSPDGCLAALSTIPGVVLDLCN